MSSRRPLTGRRDPRRLLPQEGFVPLPALTGGQRRPLQPAPAERRLPAAPNLGEGPLDLVDPPVEGAVPVVRVLLQVLGGGREPGYPGPPAQIRTCALAHTAPTLGG